MKDVVEELKEAIKNKNVSIIKSLMKTHNLEIIDKKIVSKNKSETKYWMIFYNMRQQIAKILLNSLYGAVGNEGSRFYDERIAQSTTLSGRCIVQHMISKINEIITGDYNHYGDGIIYGDTDSCYFSIEKVLKDLNDFTPTYENIVELYDTIGQNTNDSFPAFMKKAFNAPHKYGELIKASREICGVKGLFITKKRYAIMVYDKEGKRLDKNGKTGEIKAMGLDLKRSDTPKPIQDFLMKILECVLTGGNEKQVFDMIAEFRQTFKYWPAWEKGTPKRVNKLTYYGNIKRGNESEDIRIKAIRKTIPGHVLASLNWNTMKNIFNDHASMDITDGMKVIVCRLKSNPAGINSIAYPVDQAILPDWFKNLPFDSELMEQNLIDQKAGNLLQVLDWDLNQAKSSSSFNDIFIFE